MPFWAILTHFWPIFDNIRTLYGHQILVDSVFITVLVRLNKNFYQRKTVDSKWPKNAFLPQNWQKNGFLSRELKKYSKMEARFVFSMEKYVRMIRF